MQLHGGGETERRADRPPLHSIESRRLMRVLSVAQTLDALRVHAQAGRQERVLRARGGGGAARARIAQIGRDGGVVLGGAAEGLLGQAIAGLVRQRAAPARSSPSTAAYWPGSVTTPTLS